MNKYIFLTNEGYTYQPSKEDEDIECDNTQVIGISDGINEKEAYNNLLKENSYLIKSSFNEIYCYKLDNNYVESKKIFYIKDIKNL